MTQATSTTAAAAATPAAPAAASTVSAERTQVSLTLSPEAYRYFAAEAKKQHRSLANYLFVKLQTAYEQLQAAAGDVQ